MKKLSNEIIEKFKEMKRLEQIKTEVKKNFESVKSVNEKNKAWLFFISIITTLQKEKNKSDENFDLILSVFYNEIVEMWNQKDHGDDAEKIKNIFYGYKWLIKKLGKI